MLAHGAAGAVKRPVVPHAPTQEQGTGMTGKPWGRTKHGAMMHVRICSPDERQRHPGWDSASELPHIAALMRATKKARGRRSSRLPRRSAKREGGRAKPGAV